MKIMLDGEFTTLNEHIAATNANRYSGNSVKRSETERVVWQCKEQAVLPIKGYPLDLTFFWYRANRKTDPDNVSFAVKYILDGLQSAGIIRNDGWREINSICHVFKVDKHNPRVEIFLEELT